MWKGLTPVLATYEDDFYVPWVRHTKPFFAYTPSHRNTQKKNRRDSEKKRTICGVKTESLHQSKLVPNHPPIHFTSIPPLKQCSDIKILEIQKWFLSATRKLLVSTELLLVLCKMNPTTASLLLLVLLCANPQAEADRLLNSYNKLRKKSGTWKDSSRYMLALTFVVELTFFLHIHLWCLLNSLKCRLGISLDKSC